MADKKRFRSQDWFDAPGRPDMAALYLERFMNYGLTAEELRSGKPIIGIAQSGSDLNPCNRHHLELAKRVREGIREAGGIAIEFPTHPMFENCRRPTAAIDRNLAAMTLTELLYGYPIDAVVLTTGCDKTTPAAIMAASAVDIPAIVLSGGPMLDGWHEGELVGSGTVIWRSPEITDKTSYSSPIVAEVGGKRQYIQVINRGIVGIAAEDGKLLWSYQREPAYDDVVISAPVFRATCRNAM